MPELRDWYDTPLYYDIIFDTALGHLAGYHVAGGPFSFGRRLMSRLP